MLRVLEPLSDKSSHIENCIRLLNGMFHENRVIVTGAFGEFSSAAVGKVPLLSSEILVVGALLSSKEHGVYCRS